MSVERKENETGPKVFAPWKDEKQAPLIRICQVKKAFGDDLAIKEVSLDIYQREFFALLGPSGCGKSTLLRILAGLETATSGEIYLDGVDISNVPVHKRPINMMFQSYALFPHMSVEKNIAFGLKQDGLPKAEIKERTDEVIEMVQLTALRNRKPNQLSGGQQQRTALARSLVKRPKLLLLDEPLGALDKKLREETQLELVDLQEKLAMTFIIVTHDQEEAMTVASRIAVMDKGEVVQLGTPIETYEYPKTHFVANFIGDINIIKSTVSERKNGMLKVQYQERQAFRVVDSPKHYARMTEGDEVGYAIRPEKIYISKDTISVNLTEDNTDNHISGEVLDVAYLGNRTIYHVRIDSGQVMTASVGNTMRQEFMEITWGDRVVLSWDSASSLLLRL